MSGQKNTHIEWVVRPAEIRDAQAVDQLLMDSYQHLLAASYDAAVLEKALPLITKGQTELLECGTWYVAEHPIDGTLAGCGGWTLRKPKKTVTESDEGQQAHSVPHLRHFATRSDMARKGVGKAIWAKSWEDIKKMCPQGSQTVLEVFSTFTAEPFYASVGFDKVKEMTVPLTADFDFPCTLMRRDPKTN